MQVNVIKNSKQYLGLALTMVILSLGVFFTKGLNYGIDFSGGNLLQIKYENKITLHDINESLDNIQGIPQIGTNSRKVQISEDNTVIIRTQEISEDEKKEILNALQSVGAYQIDKEDKVGASVGEELKTSAIYALGIGAVLIIIYITFRFEFIFAVGAIVALLHDLILALGCISLLYYEINTPFIAAILKILGYSINDTIVVFDRIRENLKRRAKTQMSIEECLAKSVNQVMIRSINTSVTTLFAIVAILLLGGDSLRTFIVTLLVGILAGTYSSVFIATPVVYFLHKKGDGKGMEKISVEKDEDQEDEEKILV